MARNKYNPLGAQIKQLQICNRMLQTVGQQGWSMEEQQRQMIGWCKGVQAQAEALQAISDSIIKSCNFFLQQDLFKGTK